MLQKKILKNLRLSTRIFRDDFNRPVDLTHGQFNIYKAIILKPFKRVILICPTQYGKSFTVALAVLVASAIMGEKFSIVAPSKEKALIIMRHIIQHIFDDPIFYSQLDVDLSIERLKREKSKERINFKSNGGVFVVSAKGHFKTIDALIDALAGFGAPNVILDESGLIIDQSYAMVKRMVGGYVPYDFLFEIGNPFRKNHFYRTWNWQENYLKIFIDYKQALIEGRYTDDGKPISRKAVEAGEVSGYIKEMMNEPFFDILYGCKFPPEDVLDAKGYRRLLTDLQIVGAKTKIPIIKGEKRLGIDIGGGGDLSVFVIRTDQYACVKLKHKSQDTMVNVSEAIRIIKKENIKPENVFIDDIGIGRGVSDRLKEIYKMINAVNSASKAKKDDKFTNARAENFWALKCWVERGGKLEDTSCFNDLKEVKYKENSSGKLIIKPKEEMRRENIKSPDFADALALTFHPKRSKPKIIIV